MSQFNICAERSLTYHVTGMQPPLCVFILQVPTVHGRTDGNLSGDTDDA